MDAACKALVHVGQSMVKNPTLAAMDVVERA